MPVIFSYDSQVAVNRNNFGTIYFSLLSDSFLQIFPVYQNFTKRLFHVHFVDNVDNFVYKSKIAVLGLSCMWITLSCLSLPLALLCELREMVCESCTTSLLSTVSSEKKEVRQFLPKHACAALRRFATPIPMAAVRRSTTHESRLLLQLPRYSYSGLSPCILIPPCPSNVHVPVRVNTPIPMAAVRGFHSKKRIPEKRSASPESVFLYCLTS